MAAAAILAAAVTPAAAVIINSGSSDASSRSRRKRAHVAVDVDLGYVCSCHHRGCMHSCSGRAMRAIAGALVQPLSQLACGEGLSYVCVSCLSIIFKEEQTLDVHCWLDDLVRA